jgi:hypothetical protein
MMLPSPADLGPPESWPGYWMFESSGVLKPVVLAYLDGRPLDQHGISIMRSYLEQWIIAPGWDHCAQSLELAELRQSVVGLTTQKEIADWLWRALAIGIDPL